MSLSYFSLADINSLESTFRANLINSVSGIKSSNLIGTCSKDGLNNLAIFSSVFHLGANPALLGFIQRPLGAQSHTYRNILETGLYTINHVHEEFVKQAHYTSAKFDLEESEFQACHLEPEFMVGFQAPFVKESRLRIGMRFLEEIPMSLNNTILMIGQIEHIFLPANSLSEQGNISLDMVQDVAVAGLGTYYKLSKLEELPYARLNELPDFSVKTKK